MPDTAISTFATATPATGDKLLGTDVSATNATANFTVSDLATTIETANTAQTRPPGDHNHSGASDGGKLTAAAIDSYIDYEHQSTPATPGAGVTRIYAKTDGRMYRKTSDGTEAQIGTGAGNTGAVGTLYEDFLHVSIPGSGGVGQFGLVAGTNGAGSSCVSIAPPSNDSFGVFSSLTGTTTTGRAGFINAAASMIFGGGSYALYGRVQIPTLLDVTEQGQLWLGFIDNLAGPTDGAYIHYSHSNTDWRFRTKNNNVETDVASGVTVVAGTWYRFGIVVNAAGTSVAFTINGANDQAITTNIPTAAGRETGIGGTIVKSAGTTSRAFYIDYLRLDYVMTTRA